MFIATYDRATGMISFPYETDEGERIHSESFAIGPGPDVAGHPRPGAPAPREPPHEIAELGAILSGTNAESWLGVPILTGDEVLGVIALESLAEDAFDAATERLLGHARDVAWGSRSRTPGCSTRRSGCWPRRTSGRPSSRSSTRSARRSRASSTSERCIELVGERMRTIFDAQVDRHRAPRPGARPRSHFPYDARTRATASLASRSPLGTGLTRTSSRPGSRSGSARSVEPSEAVGAVDVGGDATQSWLGVPIIAATASIGVLSLESLEPSTRSARRTSACSPPSPRAWASPSRTPACSTRRSAC